MTFSDNLRGAGHMVAMTACFVAGDTCIKAAAADLPVFQVVFLRGVVGTALVAGMAWRARVLRPALAPGDGRLIALRALAEALAMIPFFIALANMPIANVSAILQMLPLVVTLAGAAVLGERVGWRRMIAIAIGFVGVILILRPGTGDFNAYAPLVLISVVLVTVRDLAVRRLSAGVPVLFAALCMATLVTAVAGVLSLWSDWGRIDTGQGGLIAAAGGFVAAGYLFTLKSMQYGALWFVTPFRYASLLWALILGWVVFGDWPDTVTLIGAFVVIATGIFTLLRNRSGGPPVGARGAR